MIPGRDHFFNIDSQFLFYLAAIIALAVFGWGLFQRIKPWFHAPRQGLDLPSLGTGLKRIFRDGLLGGRMLSGDRSAGIAHLLILWGFLGLFLGTILVAADQYLYDINQGRFYLIFSLAMEVCGLSLLAGLLWAGWRRFVSGPERLERRPADLLPLVWLLAVGVTGFLVEAARLAAEPRPWAGWSFIGSILASLFGNNETGPAAHQALWWIHALLSLGLIGYLPFAKLFHTLAGPLSLALGDQDPDRRTEPEEPEEDEEEEPEETHLGQMDLAQLIHLEACVECGRCVEVCPLARADEPPAPREVVRTLRADPDGLAEAEAAWYCTTCRACLEACPLAVAPVDLVKRARVGVVEEGSRVPADIAAGLEKLYKYQNPWLAKKGKKADWAAEYELPDLAKKDKAEWLYFVGCTTSLETRAQGLAQGLAQCLTVADLSFDTLGKKEPCCGDIARQLGELGLLDDQRHKTLRLLNKKGLARILTSSPHCYDALTKVYPVGLESGRPFEIRHYSQVLARLIREGRLQLTGPLDLKVTYHDPCYLARHNRILDEPRAVIRALPGAELVEMEEHGLNSLCCGGGGGRMWQELPDQAKNGVSMAQRRISQAAETGAQAVITACPLCLIMLEDARKTTGLEDKIRVVDLAELVAESLKD